MLSALLVVVGAVGAVGVASDYGGAGGPPPASYDHAPAPGVPGAFLDELGKEISTIPFVELTDPFAPRTLDGGLTASNFFRYFPFGGSAEGDVEIPRRVEISVAPTTTPGLKSAEVNFDNSPPTSVQLDVPAHLELQVPSHLQVNAPATRVENASATVSSGAFSTIKDIVTWLPNKVTGWFPSLTSIVPNYIPGVELEAEVHRKPVHVPTPAELVREVNELVETALARLRHKEQLIVELVSCSCPDSAKCDSIVKDLLSFSPSGVAGAPGGPLDGPEPAFSLYAGLTKPNGAGPGVGFYLDHSGPHLGHYVHPKGSEPAVPTIIVDHRDADSKIGTYSDSSMSPSADGKKESAAVKGSADVSVGAAVKGSADVSVGAAVNASTAAPKTLRRP